MLNHPATGRRLGALCLALGLLISLPARGAGLSPAVAAPACLGQVGSLVVLGDDLFIGTPAGLMYWPDQGNGQPVPVGGMARRPVKELAPEGDALVVTFGSLTAVRLELWDPEEQRFRRETPVPTPPATPLHYFQGFPARGTLPFDGVPVTATLGGGIFMGERPLAGAPTMVTALAAWQGGIVLGSPEGLSFLARDRTVKPLFRNPCRDCRLTCFARWRDEIYAGTLEGGVVRLPNYSELDPRDGLISRVNALAAGSDRLFIGTESGLFSWDGHHLVREPALGNESVKALASDGRRLYLGTTSGLRRYDFHSGKLDTLSIRKGAFLTLFQGDLYVGGMFGVWQVNLTTGFAVTRILHEYVTGFAEYGGGLYAAGYYNGLWKLVDTGAEKVVDGQFSAILPAPGGLLLGTGDAGLMFLPLDEVGGGARLHPVLVTATVTALSRSGGLVYVGTPAGYVTMPVDALAARDGDPARLQLLDR